MVLKGTRSRAQEKKVIKFLSIIAVLSVFAFLTGCGGGGGNSFVAEKPISLGFYQEFGPSGIDGTAMTITNNTESPRNVHVVIQIDGNKLSMVVADLNGQKYYSNLNASGTLPPYDSCIYLNQKGEWIGSAQTDPTKGIDVLLPQKSTIQLKFVVGKG